MTKASKTAIGDALEHLGLNRGDYRLLASIQIFIEQDGGTIARAHALVDKFAERMPGEGHSTSVSDDHLSRADAGQPVGGGEAIIGVPKGQRETAASPSSSRGEGDHRGGAPERQALPVSPVRESTTKRGLASIISIQASLKGGLLQITKRSDGILWAKTGWHELDGLDRDGTIARLIKRNANPPSNRFALLETCLTDSQFKVILDEAKKQNDSV
jgi:hypothetical protein